MWPVSLRETFQRVWYLHDIAHTGVKESWGLCFALEDHVTIFREWNVGHELETNESIFICTEF